MVFCGILPCRCTLLSWVLVLVVEVEPTRMRLGQREKQEIKLLYLAVALWPQRTGVHRLSDVSCPALEGALGLRD